jgi:hypothetical protein
MAIRGAGVFRRSLGMMAPVATLVLHILCLVPHSAGLRIAQGQTSDDDSRLCGS